MKSIILDNKSFNLIDNHFFNIIDKNFFELNLKMDNNNYLVLGKKKIIYKNNDKFIMNRIMYRNHDIILPFVIKTPSLHAFNIIEQSNNQWINLPLYIYEYEDGYENFVNYLDLISSYIEKIINKPLHIYKKYNHYISNYNYIKINCRLLKIDSNLNIINKIKENYNKYNFYLNCLISFQLCLIYNNNNLYILLYIENIDCIELNSNHITNNNLGSKVKFNL